MTDRPIDMERWHAALMQLCEDVMAAALAAYDLMTPEEQATVEESLQSLRVR